MSVCPVEAVGSKNGALPTSGVGGGVMTQDTVYTRRLEGGSAIIPFRMPEKPILGIQKLTVVWNSTVGIRQSFSRSMSTPEKFTLFVFMR